LLLITTIILLAVTIGGTGLLILICLIPYLSLFPKTAGLVLKNHDNPQNLKQAARLNVQIHMMFSLLLVVGLLGVVLL
jgi:hypothetical protein